MASINTANYANIKSDTNEESVPGFILKLYKILENDTHSHAISWNETGDGFIIRDGNVLENEVLPDYFKHNKLTSLVRQLNMYDFHKTRAKSQLKEFKHEYFRQGKPHCLKLIKRKAGEELTCSQEKADGVLSRLKDLEDKCRTYESLARLSVPIKKLKLASNASSGLLFEGLMTFLDAAAGSQDCEQTRLMNEATQEYIAKLSAIKLTASLSQPDAQFRHGAICGQAKSSAAGESSTDGESTTEKSQQQHRDCEQMLGKRIDQKQADFSQDFLEVASLSSGDFQMDLLDFTQDKSHHLDSADVFEGMF